MDIPKYDVTNTENNFINLYDFMPHSCFRLLMSGNSGSGKTNLLIHMLKQPLLYYDKLYLYAKNVEQGKYMDLIEHLTKIALKHKIPQEEIIEYSNSDIIPVTDLEQDGQKVVIFDDYVCDRNQNDIVDYFIQGRHKNCCVIYLTQSYFKTPKDIRLNCSHYIFFATPSRREVNLLRNEQTVTANQFNKATDKQYDFLYLDKPRKLTKRNFYGEII